MRIASRYSKSARVTLHAGDCLDFLAKIPDEAAKLVVTSPPYNLAKAYEKKRQTLDDYLELQGKVIADYAVRGVVGKDAVNNAVICLDMFAKQLPYAIEDSLEELEGLFSVYWQ